MDIKSILDHLNAMRKKLLKKLYIFYIVAIIIEVAVVIIVAPLVIPFEDGIELVIYIIGGFIALDAWLHTLITKKYRMAFKKELLPITMKLFGKDIKYSIEGINRELVEKVDMFGKFTKYKSEDSVRGKINDVKFQCADVKIGYMTGGKHKRYVKVCHGQLYVFDFNKRFKTKTLIREKKVSKPSDLKPVQLESIEFNQKFYIYSNNEHDAFYILTPHFMEKLKELERKHPGDLFIAFYNSKLFIGINNNVNRFEPPILSEITQATIDLQLGDLKIIEDIINELKLNNKIFIVEDEN